MSEMPPSWANLISALTLLARGRVNDISPLHCEHDLLSVMADPAQFTSAEIAQLEAWRFHPGDEGTFYSSWYGSA